MAHIPYGYRIQRGRAVPEESEVRVLNACIRFYLSGMSVKAAKEASDLPMSPSGLTDYLRKGVFAGTDYYPPIVEAGVHDRILRAMAERTHPGTKPFSPVLPVYDRFILDDPPPGGEDSPAAGSAAEALYRRIRPAASGRKAMTRKEIARLKRQLRGAPAPRVCGSDESD